MNFLVDINLPPRLCDWLRQRNHLARHLSEESLRTPDRRVWNLAAEQGQVIVSKDRDFYELSLIFGKPPQVLLIAVGNCSNEDLFQTLAEALGRIETELSAGARLVVVHTNRLEIFV